MQGVFITGTDTGVGKTHVGVLLAKALSRKNINVIPRKPVESGCKKIGSKLVPGDALALKQASGYKGELEEVCRYRFAPAVSPVRAAHLSNTQLTTDQLVKACRHQEQGFSLVEGAGGFYSPLSEDGLNADLAEALQLPVLLVAKDILGALNHVLLNTEALHKRGLGLAGIVLNNLDNNRDRHMDNVADLSERLDCAVFYQNYCGDISGELVDTVIAVQTRPEIKRPHQLINLR
ncbi:MAG: dethiobiotin synthase [Thiotrichales bacterium]|nr:MAG: dethiobiotin synthase [Thiotrichales bacterium]